MRRTITSNTHRSPDRKIVNWPQNVIYFWRILADAFCSPCWGSLLGGRAHSDKDERARLIGSAVQSFDSCCHTAFGEPLSENGCLEPIDVTDLALCHLDYHGVRVVLVLQLGPQHGGISHCQSGLRGIIPVARHLEHEVTSLS
jgi:hypothetical protein